MINFFGGSWGGLGDSRGLPYEKVGGLLDQCLIVVIVSERIQPSNEGYCIPEAEQGQHHE